MYKVIGEYKLVIDANHQQVYISPKGNIYSACGKFNENKQVDIQLVDLTNDEFLLKITKLYNDDKDMSSSYIEFKELCEDTLAKLKLGCACLVVNDTKLTYELLKILLEDF